MSSLWMRTTRALLNASPLNLESTSPGSRPKLRRRSQKNAFFLGFRAVSEAQSIILLTYCARLDLDVAVLLQPSLSAPPT